MSFRRLIRYLRKQKDVEENPRRCAKCKHFESGPILIEGWVGHCMVRVERAGLRPLIVLSHNTCKDRTIYSTFDDFERRIR